ncbi:hypothetical protein IFM89_023826 [Coptis chinensis]|uniref:Lactate/malate dehydrogenase C-terminal domain-containing protein n=1 Tax=Coptis chinensis TaxID=261450 RepID=A0A835IXB1_9MAGN|nr:hypothetical protein IFM89_023826 [Coptis chinensis]
MAAATAATFSIASVVYSGTQGSKAKSFGVRFNSGNSFKSLISGKGENHRFVESSLRALDGDTDVYEYSFVQSKLTELPFFASRIKLGKNGVETVIPSDVQGLTEYEAKALEALKPELKSSIEMGVAFAQKQAAPTSV